MVGGGEIIAIVYLVVVVIVLYLAFSLVSAIVRISHALESASHSLGEIAEKYDPKPPQQ